MSTLISLSSPADEQPIRHADTGDWLRELALSYREAGDVLRARGHFAKASEKYQASLSLFDRLAANAPDSPSAQVDLATARARVTGARAVKAKAQAGRMSSVTRIGWLHRALGILRSGRLAMH
jgi:hypothetical protein